MILELLPYDFAVCRLADNSEIDLNKEFSFYAKSDQEISYVCPRENIPNNTLAVEDGWRGLRVGGVLDFSMIGILAKIAAILAAKKISIFVVSTYDTDYIFIKEEKHEAAVSALKENGYKIETI
jgi:hypothetical protein